MLSLSAQDFQHIDEGKWFEDIFRLPSCDSTPVISSCLQERSIFSAAEKTRRLKLELDPMDRIGTCEHSVRRCRSDSTDRSSVSIIMQVTSKDDCIEIVRTCLSVDRHGPTNRAVYNFHVGLLTHHESTKAQQKRTAPLSSSDAVCALVTSGCPQDALWDLLLQ
jgi:hypothetical protein